MFNNTYISSLGSLSINDYIIVITGSIAFILSIINLTVFASSNLKDKIYTYLMIMAISDALYSSSITASLTAYAASSSIIHSFIHCECKFNKLKFEYF
jgi:hypothetical protein